MKSVDLMITGAVMAVIGWFMFDNRGFVARVALNATTVGNTGWDTTDAHKIGLIALAGLGILVIGTICAIVGLRDYLAKKEKG